MTDYKNPEEVGLPDKPECEAELPAEEQDTAEEPVEVTQPDPLALLETEKNDLNDRLLRLMAEYDNYRKRTTKEREGLYPEAEAGIISQFLPFVDNFERALQSDCADPEFKKGMELIWQSFSNILSDLKVESIGEVGESFDPNLHNAVMHTEDEALGENVISQVLQKGYRRGERILRYAMVQTAN